MEFLKGFFLSAGRTGESTLKSTAKSLGVKSMSAGKLGSSLIPAIQDIMIFICIISAIAVVCLSGFYVIISKKQEDRSQAMARIMWAIIGLIITSMGAGIIGYAIHLIK